VSIITPALLITCIGFHFTDKPDLYDPALLFAIIRDSNTGVYRTNTEAKSPLIE